MNIYVGDTTQETLEDFDLRIQKLEFIWEEMLEDIKALQRLIERKTNIG